MAEKRHSPLVLTGAEPASTRSNSLENPSVSLVDPKAWAQIFGDWRSSAGVSVDPQVAMSVPAVWCAVTFLGGCIASLPLKLHRKSANGKEQIERGAHALMLAGKVNDEYLTSFNWRRDLMTSTLLRGRSLTYVERQAANTGDARYLWPIELAKTTIKRQRGRMLYQYRDASNSQTETYTADQIIDIKFLGALDGVDHFDPVMTMKDTIGLAVAIRTYASRYFLNGGVPPLALEGPAASPAAVARGKSDMGEAVKQSTRDESGVIYLPPGHKLTPVALQPEKGQLLDAQRFIVEEVARIFNIPPAFLHHLVNATFANVEQQDLNFVKHSLVHWIEQIEQELNAKMFGTARGRYIEFDLNALLRGDLVSRMGAYAQAIQFSVMKPNEARRRENLPDDPAGDRLMANTTIQPLPLPGEEPAPVDPNDPNAKPAPAPGAKPGDPGTTGDPGGEQDNPGDPVTDPEDT